MATVTAPSPGAVGSSAQSGKERLAAVDVCRALAAFSVVCVHTGLFTLGRIDIDSPLFTFGQNLFLAMAHAAVPFFFSLSGYFWGKRMRSAEDARPATRRMLWRMVTVYAFWSVVYVLPLDFWAMRRDGLVQALKYSYWGFLGLRNPARLLLTGDAGHLWFLPARFFALIIAYFLVSRKKTGLLVITAAALYIGTVLSHAYFAAYVGFPLRIGHFPLDTRDGPFVGTLFFTMGYLVSARNPKRKWVNWGLAIFAAGLVVQCSEIGLIRTYLHGGSMPMETTEYVFGTVGIGLGSLLVALAGPAWLQNQLLARLGKVALGIYCIHYYFVQQFKPIVYGSHNPVIEILFPFAVVLLSLLVTWMLSKSSLTRQFVQ